MQTDKKLISIIVPVFNEERHILLFFKELGTLWHKLSSHYNFELIFVNDGSTDNSEKEIKKLTDAFKQVKYLEFSRNFGKETAISAGIDAAQGDSAIIIDADLQHPIDLIPQFIKRWEQGAEVVVGVRG